MELVEISPEEFQKFAVLHPLSSFFQTTSWAELKETNGWKSYYIALKEGKTIKAATLLLEKKLPLIKRKMVYAPRGFLIDFSDFNLLKTFTIKLKDFVKKKGNIFLKIDPYVMYQERDRFGNIVENGFNNKKSYDNLVKLGYRHFGFNLYQETLQARWIYTKNVKGKSIEDLMKDMDHKTRQILRRNEKNLIRVREIGEDELCKFKDIMQHTGDRREFIDRPLSYYKEMYKYLKKNNIITYLLAELNISNLINNLENEIKELENDYNIREKKYNDEPGKMNKEKFEKKQHEVKKEIERISNKIEELSKLKKNGDVIVLGGILFLKYGKEVLSLVGGTYDKYMDFQSAYTLHWEMIKYAAENGYEKYNFYGITGDFTPKNPLYGLYVFKESFGGQVEELIGEFDLIINKPMYYLYKVAYGIYRKAKNIIKR